MYFIESEYLSIDFAKSFFHHEQAVKALKKQYKKEKGAHSWQYSNVQFSIGYVLNESGNKVASINNKGVLTIFSWNI